MPKVSVIMPVYNSEMTLIDSLSSLVTQTLTDIELILVNDYSTDNSLKILADCEAQFSDKVLLINLDENHGAGGARNIGLSYASGDYIGFMDSDDIAVPDMFEKMYAKAISGNYDIVDCGYYNEAKDSAIVHASDELTGELNGYKRSELIASGGYFWSKLIKKSFLDRIGLQFREHCILEDLETLMYLFATASSIGNVKEILYCYKNSAASISKHIDYNNYYNNVISAIEAAYSQLSVLPDYTDIQYAVEYEIYNLCSLALNCCLNSSNSIPAYILTNRITDIRTYINKYIKLPVQSNKFINNKIDKQDLHLLSDIDKIISQLG